MTTMLPIKHVTKHRLRSKSFVFSIVNPCSSSHAACASLAASLSPSTPSTSNSFQFTRKDVVSSFKTWFATRKVQLDPLVNRIYQLLTASADNEDLSAALSALSLPLSECLVLRVLRYTATHRDIFSCLKFFDWAGRQPNFHHTRATFVAIFNILVRADHKPIVLEFLDGFRRGVFLHNVRFHDILVVGYAIARKPQNALHAYAQMRFIGLDLDSFSYHVLLDSLVEKNYLNAFDIILRQIRARGFENHATNIIVVKHLCKERRLEETEGFLNDLVRRGEGLKGPEVSFLVGALCECFRFERAVELVKRFGSSGLVPLDHAYGAWVKGLVRGGRVNEALEFFSQKKDSEGYCMSSSRYNVLIYRLLRENRLQQVYDLLVDMNESCIPPDVATMNAVLCFFCKVGMADVAWELYSSRSEFGLSLNHLACKYLILTLCWDGGVVEAYNVVKSLVGKSYFPDEQTFRTLASALCRECKIDEMIELMHLSVGRDIVPPASMYDQFIYALCQAGRVQDGYLVHGELKTVAARASYVKMINGFVKSGRGDIAAQLLFEMKLKGHKLNFPLCTSVICCLLKMDNSRGRFFNLLEMLTRCEFPCRVYNFFMEGAARARKPDLCREVFELMQINGVEPNLNSRVLVLRGYLRSGRISDALSFFNVVRGQGLECKRLYTTLVNGLCKCNRIDMSLGFFLSMFRVGLNPSLECYELLVQELCSLRRYQEAIRIVNAYEKMGRPISSFMGNQLLQHSLISPKLYDTCVYLRGVGEGEFSANSTLNLVIGAFSGCLRVTHYISDLERLIEKCFPPDIFTYNLLLKELSKSDMDKARLLFGRICQKGYEPDGWTYHIMLVEDTEVFMDGTLGGSASGGKLNTYKELCNLANEMGQLDLIYKFMDLANYQASLNSKRGAAFGFSKIAKQAGDALKPYLRSLLPRLVRYQYDPDKNVQIY
ncbi:pentatricopeptide repeat-containing protein At1g71210, mitochondrial isoform X2 [Vigna angularis]|uniref:pentatricopeptide repeat-containing protein At1g71210, mitochondrial isoform X2 n=1 Tax=Phaseolus angularis TaxID=3914 RepID=UPI0022B4B51F|nr:pentatricopeptide repeat-containing protein At1g71210, mitochondrial isoform X2 [Vigna angularis]